MVLRTVAPAPKHSGPVDALCLEPKHRPGYMYIHAYSLVMERREEVTPRCTLHLWYSRFGDGFPTAEKSPNGPHSYFISARCTRTSCNVYLRFPSVEINEERIRRPEGHL